MTRRKTLHRSSVAFAVLLVVPALAAGNAAGAPAGPAGSPASAPTVLTQIRIVQLNAPITQVSMSGSMKIQPGSREGHGGTASSPNRRAAPPPSGTERHEVPVGPGRDESGMTVTLVTDDALIKFGDRMLHFVDGRFFERIGGIDHPWVDINLGDPQNSRGSVEGTPSMVVSDSDDWEVLFAPNTLSYAGQKAEIMMGQSIPYMVKHEDGSLEVKHGEDIEGASISVIADSADPEIVSLEFDVRLSKLVGRQRIPGVPFDVGRPIIRTIEISSALQLGPKHVAIISLPRQTEDNPPIFIFLTARCAEQE